mmetsp:Transcript_9593/g.13563  ORF Transcript_9593/g.13563 Transcript_9593/m.13563 type:complete len:128 (+) Transcript_9593:26-409(+)
MNDENTLLFENLAITLLDRQQLLYYCIIYCTNFTLILYQWCNVEKTYALQSLPHTQLSMSGALDKMADGFFNFEMADQIGVLAIVFAVIFAAVSMSIPGSPVSSPPITTTTTTSSSTKNSSNNVKKD